MKNISLMANQNIRSFMVEETYTASEPMKKFFSNLLELKEYVRIEFNKNKENNDVINEIHHRLNKIIKEGDVK